MKGKSFILGFCLALLLWGVPAEAADPPECAPSALTNFPVPGGITCAYTSGLTYDLLVQDWDSTTHISEDIRVGYDWSATPPLDQPKFFIYEPTPGNYAFYTWLYAKFYNNGATVCPAEPSTGTVRVVYSYKPVSDYTEYSDPTGWTHIDDYTMVIPASPGALLTNNWHYQQHPVCWILPVGQRFPAQFIVRAEVAWTGGTHPEVVGGSTDSITTNNVTYSYFDMRSEKGTAYIGLAMDLSGSMGGSVSPGVSKLRAAKDTGQLFTHLVEAGNYLGVYGFSTSNSGLPANTPPVPGNSIFWTSYIQTGGASSGLLSFNETSIIHDMSQISEINPLNDKINISNWIDRQADWGCTPIGQGLLRAKKAIDFNTSGITDPINKGIVLFSDGLQNIPPLLGGADSSTCGSPSPYPDIDVEQTFGNNDIPIYSIYFGSTSYWGYNVMADIQDESADIWVYGASTQLELAEVYYAIRGMVDDLIKLEKGQTTPLSPSSPFTVDFDGAADTATVAVAWERGNNEIRLTVERRMKGDSQWIPCSGNRERIETNFVPGECIAYPTFEVSRFKPGANTSWEFRVRQVYPKNGSITFSAAVFSNVKKASIKASLGSKGFEAGKDLPLYVDLHSGGHAVAGAAVTAVVKVPVRSFSSTLRKYMNRFVPAVDPDSGRVAAMVPQLKKFLKRDTGSDKFYVYKDVTLTLRDDGAGADKMKGDGRYSAVLPGTQTRIADRYEAVFTAKGELSAGRQFERNTILSAVADVGAADPAKSVVEMSVSAPQPNGKRIVTITILPTDKYGNAAFPGSSRDIKVMATSGTLKGGVVDNQDSSFTQLLELEKGQDPEVTVVVDGVKLKPVSPMKPPSFQHELSLHGGIAAPEGMFDLLVDSGKALVFDYGYRFTHNFSVRFALGFNWFEDLFDESLLLTNVNAYLQYRFLSGRLVPYFEAGPGFYKLEGSSSALGYSSGVGVRYILSRHLDLDINVHGHRAGGKLDIGFFQFLAGIIFKF